MLMKRFIKVFDLILDLCAGLSALLCVAMMLFILIDIFLRYFLGKPTGIVMEFSEYALVYICFLGAAWVQRRDEHVRLELFHQYLSSKDKNLLNGFSSLLGAIIFILFTYFSADLTLDYFRKGTTMVTELRMPKWPIMAIIPIGCSLLSIQYIRMTLEHFIKWKELKSA
jgi:C4-dicarboxylate transporter, DctQ subunit